MNLGPILRAMVDIAEHESIHLVLDQTEVERKWLAAFRVPAYGPGNGTYPIFDPVAGEICFAATGDTPEQAMLALQEVIRPFVEEAPKA